MDVQIDKYGYVTDLELAKDILVEYFSSGQYKHRRDLAELLEKIRSSLIKYEDGYTFDDEEMLSIKSGCIPIKVDAPRVPTPEDKVNHPGHYTWLKQLCGIEVIDITRHMDFDLGNAIKYILRCGHKEELGYSNKEKTIEDLRKAIFYINDKIEMLERQ